MEKRYTSIGITSEAKDDFEKCKSAHEEATDTLRKLTSFWLVRNDMSKTIHTCFEDLKALLEMFAKTKKLTQDSPAVKLFEEIATGLAKLDKTIREPPVPKKSFLETFPTLGSVIREMEKTRGEKFWLKAKDGEEE